MVLEKLDIHTQKINNETGILSHTTQKKTQNGLKT